MRPTLLPDLRRLWRDERTVQLGTDPATAIILELHRPELARVLDLLDGSHTERTLLTGAEALGLDADDVSELLHLLRSTGLVLSTHALLPAGLPPGMQGRLTVEAAAIALRMRTATTRGPGGTTRDHRPSRRQTAPNPTTDRDPGATNPTTDQDPGATNPTTDQDPGAANPATEQVPGAADRATGQHPGAAGRRNEAGKGQRTPADVLRRRRAARVVVAGDGPLVAPLAAILASAGVGHVHPAVDGVTSVADVLVGGVCSEDVSAARAIATAAAIVRFAPGVDVSAARADSVDFVVRVGDRRPPALASRGLRLGALPRLEVTVRLGTVLVGPLVRPSASPCRGCLELHRRDRDPAWPALEAQLATAPPGNGEPCALTTAVAGVAFAAGEVLDFLDGAAPRTEAAIVEIAGPGDFRRREWAVHPRCDCRRRRRSAPTG